MKCDKSNVENENLYLLNNVLYEAFHENEKAKEFLIEELPLLYLNEEYPNITDEEKKKEQERLTHFISGLLESSCYQPDKTLNYLVNSLKRKTVRSRTIYKR